MYTLVALIVLAGFLVVDDALRRRSPGRLGVIALLSGTLVLTHYWGFWFIAAVLCVIGWQAFRASDADHRNGGTAGRPGDLCRRPPVPALVAQLPRPGSSHRHPVGRAPATGLDRGRHRSPSSAVATSRRRSCSGRSSSPCSSSASSAAVPTRGTSTSTWPPGRRCARGDHRRAHLVIGALAGYASQSTYAARYASVFFPLVVLVVAAGIARFVGPLARNLVLAGVVVFSLVGAGVNVFHTEPRPVRSPTPSMLGPP